MALASSATVNALLLRDLPYRDPDRLAEDVVKPRFEAVDGVAGVTVVGGRKREVRLLADPAKLAAHGLSLLGLAQQIGAESFDLPAGRIDSGAAEMNVRTGGRFRTLDELRGAVVASLPSGAQVRLGEIARVEDGFAEVRTASRLDGGDAVLLEVQKQAGSNSIAVATGTPRSFAPSGSTWVRCSPTTCSTACKASCSARRRSRRGRASSTSRTGLAST